MSNNKMSHLSMNSPEIRTAHRVVLLLAPHFRKFVPKTRSHGNQPLMSQNALISHKPLSQVSNNNSSQVLGPPSETVLLLPCCYCFSKYVDFSFNHEVKPSTFVEVVNRRLNTFFSDL